MAAREPQAQISQIQRQIQQDWANREYIDVITYSMKKITDFLNSFGKSKTHGRIHDLLRGRACNLE